LKKVRFDENVPRQLRKDLSAFEIRTVQEQGWSSLKNGDLLRTASNEFAVLVTADKNLQCQQNIPKFNIGIVVLALRDVRLPNLLSRLGEIEAAIAEVTAGAVIRIGAP
jgi:predicted nuclease of predicted toxin-antitoxin system